MYEVRAYGYDDNGGHLKALEVEPHLTSWASPSLAEATALDLLRNMPSCTIVPKYKEEHGYTEYNI